MFNRGTFVMTGGSIGEAATTNETGFCIIGGSRPDSGSLFWYGGGVLNRGSKAFFQMTGLESDLILTNDGTFNYNEAQMGGGAHLLGGAKLIVSGGEFIGNRAHYNVGTGRRHDDPDTPYEWTTAKNTERYDICPGVGGAIYLGAGLPDENDLTELICLGTEDKTVAVYGNIADKAGNEIVSSGLYTKLNLPDRIMRDAQGHRLDWFEDYLVKYAMADTEAELLNAPLQDIISFRDGTGDQDVAKGWCWITIPIATENKLYKIVILNQEMATN